MITRAHLLVGLSLWAVVAVTVLATAHLPVMQEGAPGPRFVPLLMAAALGVLTVAYWIEVARDPAAHRIAFPGLSQLRRPAGFACLALATILLWERLGAIPTAFLATALELSLLQRVAWPRSLAVGLAAAVFIWLFFGLVLGVTLPVGIFGTALTL